MTRAVKTTKKTEEGRRPERVGAAVLDALSRALVRELSDPRLVNVTLTSVSVSPDLSSVRVGVRALGDDEAFRKSAAAVKALTRAEGGLRRILGSELALRRVPGLLFEVDKSWEEHARLDRLMAEVAREVKPSSGGEGSGA